MIRSRPEVPKFGRGSPRLLQTGDDAVLAYCCDWSGQTAVGVQNLSSEDRTVRLGLGDVGYGPSRATLGDRLRSCLDLVQHRN
jgi:hypothetical protein